MTEPTSPDVATAAAAGLSVAGVQLAGMAQAVSTGSVRLTPDAATALLSALGTLTGQAANLVTYTEHGLDQQLHLGHNWIGTIMDDKFRGAVSGGPDALRPVLEQFHAMLGQVTDTVRRAAGLTAATDQQIADQLRTAGRWPPNRARCTSTSTG